MGNRVHTNVSLRGAHGGWGNSKDLLDSLTSEAKFSHDLLSGEGGEPSVRPSVDADFVAGHVFFSQNVWLLNNTRTDDEEGSRDILIVKVFEQSAIKHDRLDVWGPAS